MDVADRELREPTPDLAKAIGLLERVLEFSEGASGVPLQAFASPIAQLYVDWSGAQGRARLEARLEELRRGEVPVFEVLPRLRPNLQLPANAPGWEALRAHLGPTYGRRYVGGQSLVVPVGRMPVRAMGNPFLEEIWVFAHPSGHWHFMTFGLTSLGGPVPASATGVDGFGFELTVRVAPAQGERGVPTWPAALLYDFAAFAQKTAYRFEVGHHMPHGRSLAGDLPSTLRAVGFAEDPELGRATTPYGRMTFLQLVGLTEDEEAFAAEWSADGLFTALAESNPLHVLHLDRESLLTGPSQRTQRIRWRKVPCMRLESPEPKKTTHPILGSSAEGVADQKFSAGVEGNAAASRVGPGGATDRSTRDSSSFLVGARQPVENPPRFRPWQ